MPHLVGNTENRFSHYAAQIIASSLVDSGRELRITAGFKHIKAKKGTALFDLIEEYEEKPIQTP